MTRSNPSPLQLRAAALVDVAQPLSHLFPSTPTEPFTVAVPHALGAAATEALAEWDDAVLQTQGVERDRYAHSLPHAQGELQAAEHLAVALHLALDLPAGTFDPNDPGTVEVTLQPFHAAQLRQTVGDLEEAQRLTAEALPARSSGPKPR